MRGASGAAAVGWVGAGAMAFLLGPGPSAVQTHLQQTTPVIWVLLAISIAGAAITWGVMVYILWRFRDPATRGRRYG